MFLFFNRSCCKLDHKTLDCIRKFNPDIAKQHNLFIQSCQQQCSGKWHTLTDDGYMHQQLLHHAIAADNFEIVVDLLTNLPWIEVKLKACNNSLSDLLRDYDLCETRLDDKVNLFCSYLLNATDIDVISITL